jgi:hypothetical protein
MDAVQLYQQSLDPTINTQAAFDNVRQEVKQLLQQNQYNSGNRSPPANWRSC